MRGFEASHVTVATCSPWSLATLKNDLHVVGVQGEVTDEFANRIADATTAYLTA